jgi:hypothetical protein
VQPTAQAVGKEIRSCTSPGRGDPAWAAVSASQRAVFTARWGSSRSPAHFTSGARDLAWSTVNAGWAHQDLNLSRFAGVRPSVARLGARRRNPERFPRGTSRKWWAHQDLNLSRFAGVRPSVARLGARRRNPERFPRGTSRKWWAHQDLNLSRFAGVRPSVARLGARRRNPERFPARDLTQVVGPPGFEPGTNRL